MNTYTNKPIQPSTTTVKSIIMLDFFTDIKNELDSKYNDATIYENREIAKRAAENYIDDVHSRLSDYAKGDPLYKRDASATDLPCMSLVKVWVKPGAIAMYNKVFRYKDDEVTYMAKAELDQWFDRTCQELKACGML